MTGKREFEQVLKRCESAGWRVDRLPNGHAKIYPTDGPMISTGPFNSRSSRQNLLSRLVAVGLETAEEQAEARGERSRRDRISRARGSVGDALLDAVQEREVEEERVKKEVAQKEGALGYVDGVAIVEKAQAMHTTPISNGARPLTDGEELLLADGNVVYRCMKPAATTNHPELTGTCHRTFDSVGSLKGHITFHSRKTMPVPPGVRRKAEREKREQAARDAKAAVKKAAKKAADTSPQGEPGVVARVVELTKRVNRLSGDVDQANKELDEVAAELAAIAQELPSTVVDEEVIEKARKYDHLRQLMG